MSIFDKTLAHPGQYDFAVERLGEAKLPSPIRNPVFVPEASRRLITTEVDRIATCAQSGCVLPSFECAGPHARIFHDPAWSRAAILTAGGLCPGINHVIKGLVEILAFDYGISTIYGIRYGYRGLIARYGYTPLMLDPETVDTIHCLGGTILGSSRGQEDTGEMADALTRMNINLLFCIGGDGTLRAARELADECRRRKAAISIIVIPKTIDNDLNFVGRSFGFETAVAETTPIIDAAHMEAKGAVNGIGLVKLMGRDSGFIASYATIANPVVNFCLIPEEPFALEGPRGLLAALETRLQRKAHAVIVVAEGAGQEHIAGVEEQRDASGNVLKKDIGEFLKGTITRHLRDRNTEVSVKYFDPSYTIRSVPAKGADAIRCYMLARNAVHAAMAGRTNCVVSNLHHGGTYTLVPLPLVAIERQHVDLAGDLWRAVVDATGQNDYFNPSPRGSPHRPPPR